MAESSGAVQNNGVIRWWARDLKAQPGVNTVSVAVDAYFESVRPYSQYYNGSKSWSGFWGSGSASQAYNLGPGARVKVVTFSRTVTLTDSWQTLSFSVVTNHFFGSTSSTWSIRVPPRYAQTPTGLKITRNSDTSHRLDWSRRSTYSAVVVQRRVNSGSWTQVARPGGNAFTWTDTSTRAGNKYEYRVAGVGGSGQSGWSNTVTAYTSPTAPTGVSAERVGNNIVVNASGRPAHASSYNIRDGSTVVASNVQLPWTHTSPNAAQVHQYTVQGVVSGLAGAWSAASNTVQLISAPLAPVGLDPNGAVSVSDQDTLFKWKHSPVDSSAQSAAEMRIRVKGQTAWLGTLTATTAQQVKTPITSAVWEWQVRTKGAHPDWSPWSAIATATVIDRPGVAVTLPDGLWTRRTVTAEWSWAQAQGRPQSSWEARLVGPEGEIERRTGTGATGKVEFAAKVLDNVSYGVIVRAATGVIWSDPAEQWFLVQVPPAAPADMWGKWSDDSGANTISVQDGRGPFIPEVTNKFQNSLFLGNGTWVELMRNEIRSPMMSSGSAGWVVNGTNFTHASVEGGRSFIAKQDVSTTVSIISTRNTHYLAIGGGEEFVFTMGVRNDGERPFTVSLDVFPRDASGSNPGSFLGESVTLAPGETAMLVTAGVTAESTADIRSSLRAGSSVQHGTFPSGGVATVLDGITMLRGTQLSQGLIAGSLVSPIPDLRARWLGAVDESETVLEGERVRASASGGGAQPIVTEVNGVPGCRVASEKATSNATSYYVTGASNTSTAMSALGIEPGGTYRAKGTIHVLEEQTGPFDSAARRIMVGAVTPGGGINYSLGVSPAAPNEVGAHELSVDFTVPADATNCFIRLMNGTRDGQITWSDFGLFDGVDFDGPVFNGSSGLVNVGGSWMAATWDGEISRSTSTARMAPAAVRADVERSVDDGLTWVPFIEGAELPVLQTDPEAKSNGVTLYRVTTYSADDATSVVIHEVHADSQAAWLSGGGGFVNSARLPYDPSLSATAGRSRAARRYDGREKPVAHSGEALTRTLAYGGTLVLGEHDPYALGDLVAARSPVFLVRMPDGLHMYGIVNDVRLLRETAETWSFDFDLTETERE